MSQVVPSSSPLTAARDFGWPPAGDPERRPYRGFDAFEAEDVGVYFGREGSLALALDELRHLSEAQGSRFLIILGGPSVGTSSFLRGGLWPRLAQDKTRYLPLPVLRPRTAAISGSQGFVAALAQLGDLGNFDLNAARIREALAAGPEALRALVRDIVARAPEGPDHPRLTIGVDQAEELFCSEGAVQSEELLNTLRMLADAEELEVLVVLALRSDAYARLLSAHALRGVRPRVFSLAPMTTDELRAAVVGPAERVSQTGRTLEIDPEFTQALLADADVAGDDASSLASFALETLYAASGNAKRISLDDYKKLGGLSGAVDAAFERAMEAAEAETTIPKARKARLELLQAALVPAFACVDPATRKVRRRTVSAEQIPQEARPLINLLIEQRLMTRTIQKATGETSVEIASDVLLRRWPALAQWLDEEFEWFATLDGVKRAALKWDRHSRLSVFATHNGVLLEQAQRLYGRADFTSLLGVPDRAYLVACFEETKRARDEEEKRMGAQTELIEKENHKLTARVRSAKWRALTSTIGFAGALALATFAGWKWLESAGEKRDALTRRDHTEKAVAQLADAANSLTLSLAERLKEFPLAPAAAKVDILSEARKLQEKLRVASRDSDESRRSESIILNEIVQARLAMGDFAGALEAAQKSTALMTALAAAKPDDLDRQRDLSVSYERLGDAQRATGALPAALKSYRDDLAIAQSVASANASNPQWRWDLSTSYEKIGDVQRAQNDLDGALNSYREALMIRAKLLAAGPTKADWRRDLAVSHERVAAILAKQGDVEGARSAYEQALAIYGALIRDDSGDDQSISYSIVPHWRLAELDKANQREHLQAALQGLRTLAAKDRLDAKHQAWLSQVEGQLKTLDQPATLSSSNTKSILESPGQVR